MIRPHFRSLRCSAVALLSLIAGCQVNPPCTEGLHRGDKLEVEVIERFDEGSTFAFRDVTYAPSCGQGFDDDFELGAKRLLELQTAWTEGRECADLACPSDFPSQGEATNDGHGFTVVGQYVCIAMTDVAVSDTCMIKRSVTVDGLSATDAFDAAPVAGQTPPAIARRFYSASADDCPEFRELFPADAVRDDTGTVFCGDAWVLVVRRVE